MDDAEAEDIQRAIHLSLQGEPQDEPVAGPSNCPPPPISTIPPPPAPLPLANPTPMEQVVTISIESFCSPACLGWLQDVARSGRLGTIMFDEAHGLVEDVRFREAYGTSIRRLLEIRGCTIMFCSATLSPHFMQDFWRHLKIALGHHPPPLPSTPPPDPRNPFPQRPIPALGSPRPRHPALPHPRSQ